MARRNIYLAYNLRKLFISDSRSNRIDFRCRYLSFETSRIKSFRKRREPSYYCINAEENSFRRRINELGLKGHWNEAIALLRSSKSSGNFPMNVTTYNTIIAAIARCGRWREAITLLSEMKNEGMKPDKFSFSSAITACTKGRKWDKAIDLMREMKESEIHLDNAIVWDNLISACAKDSKWDVSLSILRDMKEMGIMTTIQSYVAILDACAKSGQWNESLCLLYDMVNSGVQPDASCFNTAINACVKDGICNEALKIFNWMKESGIKPNQDTFNAVINACKNGNQPEMALEVIDEMLNMGLEPNDFMYSTVIRACIINGEYKFAIDFLDHIQGKGMSVTLLTYAATIEACSIDGQYQQAIDIIRLMKSKELIPDSKCCTYAMNACINANQYNEAVKLFDEFEKPDLSCFNAALKACDLGGLGLETQRIVSLMTCRKKSNTYRHIVNALDKLDNPDVCVDDFYREGVRYGVLNHWNRSNLVFCPETYSPSMVKCAMNLVLDGILGLDRTACDKHTHDPNSDLIITFSTEINKLAVEKLRTVVEDVLTQRNLIYSVQKNGGTIRVWAGGLILMCEKAIHETEAEMRNLKLRKEKVQSRNKVNLKHAKESTNRE